MLWSSVPDARDPASNHLLDSLPRPQRTRLLKLCRLRDLEVDDVLSIPGSAGTALLFPLSGLVSQSLVRTGAESLQLLALGSEGLIGAAGVLRAGAETLAAVVAVRGVAVSLDRRFWNQAVAASPRLCPLLQRYQGLQSGRLARSAVCLALHAGEQRLVRWLLEAADRVGDAPLPVTHERLGRLLGLRRSGVTVLAGNLHRSGLIDYHRGRICLRDLAGLEAAACACYLEDRHARAGAFADLRERR
ncbi:MAG: Crp/Fnr family transcriptional regulator [Lysobacterales bacterium]|jgi:CRP-like cAMP-binding protein